MATDDRDDLEGEAAALKELLESDGWRRFLAHVDRMWGAEAQIARLDEALSKLDVGDEGGERVTAQQIRLAARSIHGLVTWPTERLRALTQKRPARGPFSGLRRIAQ